MSKAETAFLCAPNDVPTTCVGILGPSPDPSIQFSTDAIASDFLRLGLLSESTQYAIQFGDIR